MLLRLLTKTASAPPTPKMLADDRSPQAVEFHKALLAAHFQTVRQRFKEQQKGNDLAAKASVSLCRYCTEFPVDRAFYEAGINCKNANMINMAFFFLNRFLDISDAIEDPENAQIDNTDFMDTDIPSPYDLDMPETAYIQGPQVEEIRDWVLGWSMDENVKQKMDLQKCDKCRKEQYCASLTCNSCGWKNQPCIV